MNIRNLTEDQIKDMLEVVGEQGNKNHEIKKAHFSPLESCPVEDVKEEISSLNDVELEMQVELGSTDINLREVMNLYEGQVITLNRLAGDTVDLKVDNIWLAHGEVLVLNEVLAIRISSFDKDDEYAARGVK